MWNFTTGRNQLIIRLCEWLFFKKRTRVCCNTQPKTNFNIHVESTVKSLEANGVTMNLHFRNEP